LTSAIGQLAALQGSLTRSAFDVDAMATEIGPDVQKAHQFVRDQIRFDAYEGVLRGARGALMARGGNAFDKSLLLAALLRHHGIEVQFKTATLPLSTATSLVAQTYGPQTRAADARASSALRSDAATAASALLELTLSRFHAQVDLVRRQLEEGRVRLGTATANAAEALAADVRRHCWIEYRSGQGWMPLDATLATAPSNEGDSHAELPDSDFHRVVLRMRVDERTRGTVESRDLLHHEVRAADVHGAAVTFEPRLTIGEVEWLAAPELTIDGVSVTGEELRGRRDEDMAAGLSGGIQGGLGDRLSGGLRGSRTTRELAAVWLEADFVKPSGSRDTVRRELFDRIGPAARLSGTAETASLAAVPTLMGVPAPLLQVFALSFSAGDLHPGLVAASLDAAALKTAHAEMSALETAKERVAEKDVGHARDSVTSSLRALAQSFHVHSALVRRELEDANVRFYEATPRLAIASMGFAVSPGGRLSFTQALDLRRNEMRTVSRDHSVPKMAWANVLRGLLDGVVERTLTSEVAASGEAGRSISAVSILEQAPASDVGLKTVAGLHHVADIAAPASVKARLSAAVNEGAVAIVPVSGLEIDGEVRTGWWRVEPPTGETLSVMDTGLHYGGPERTLQDRAFAWAVTKVNTRWTIMLLMAIYRGDVVVREPRNPVQTVFLVYGGIVAVIMALAYAYQAGHDAGTEEERRRQEEDRRPPAPMG
jgi:hypothetical protein